MTMTLTDTSLVVLPRIIKSCPRCGGRLYWEQEPGQRRPVYILECFNCSRTFDRNGSPLTHRVHDTNSQR